MNELFDTPKYVIHTSKLKQGRDQAAHMNELFDTPKYVIQGKGQFYFLKKANELLLG
jgi:hypothetical protein